MMFFLLCVFFFMYRCLSLHDEVRILQLQHYQIERQIEYLMKKVYISKEKWYRFLMHLPFGVLLFVSKGVEDFFLMLVIVYMYIAFKFQQVQKTKSSLHFTKRVQRLYILLFLLYSFFLYVGKESDCFLVWAIALMCVNKEMVFLANLMITPLEKLIQQCYILQARKMLQENARLLKIGIVGSYGKTSTKNILFHLLKENYLCLKSEHSYNNMMGNTITIRKQLRRLHELFICEMGSDHVGEIARLMHFIEPQYVIITSIGNQHLNTFHTQENIVKEKMSPLQYLKKEDVAFLNIDNAYIKKNKEIGICKKITFGEDPSAHFRVGDITLLENGSTFSITYRNTTTLFKTSLLGYYNVMNLAGGICVAHTFEVPMVVLQRLCASIKPIEHRLYSIDKGNYTLIDNAYNSNVKSFKNSLQILERIDKYTILITPGLIDLKEDAKENEKLMNLVSGKCDEVVIVGYRNRNALIKGLKNNHFEPYHCLDTMEEALQYIDNHPYRNFVALIENDIDKSLMNMKN